MTSISTVEQRLEALEIKASYTEDLVDKLDHIIIRQQRTLDALLAEVRDLRDLRAQSTSSGEGCGQRNLRDDLPPHY
jgi:SlyX protein